MLNGSPALRVVFMGTPKYAIPVLSVLLDESYDVVGVYTRPDRPAGRSTRAVPTEIKRFALDRELPVFQPGSLRRDEEARREMASLSPDVVVVAAYGLFLPSEILGLPPLACLNVHPSLLPMYRGPSPVSAAILGGDEVSGVTIIKLDEGMDSGPIVAQRETPLGPLETTESLTTRLFDLGATLLTEVLPGWKRGDIQPLPQDDAQATVTSLLTRGDGDIDWSHPAIDIDRQVRAYFPWPGSFTRWSGRLLKIIEAAPFEQQADVSAAPGQVIALPEGVGVVVTGEGLLAVRRLQLEGRRPVSVEEFLRGHRDLVGSVLGA